MVLSLLARTSHCRPEYTLVYYGVSLLSKEKQLVCLFQYIAGLFKNILHLKPVKILLKKIYKILFC